MSIPTQNFSQFWLFDLLEEFLEDFCASYYFIEFFKIISHESQNWFLRKIRREIAK